MSTFWTLNNDAFATYRVFWVAPNTVFRTQENVQKASTKRPPLHAELFYEGMVSLMWP